MTETAFFTHNRTSVVEDGVSVYLPAFRGDTSNAMIVAARQGAKTGYLTAVGTDMLTAPWEYEGVDAPRRSTATPGQRASISYDCTLVAGTESVLPLAGCVFPGDSLAGASLGNFFETGDVELAACRAAIVAARSGSGTGAIDPIARHGPWWCKSIGPSPRINPV